MKLTELLESKRNINGVEFEVDFFTDDGQPHITIFANGMEINFRATLEVETDSYDDGFGWSQGDQSGSENWTGHEITGVQIYELEPVFDVPYMADELADVFSVPEERFQKQEDLLAVIAEFFGGDKALDQYISQSLTTDPELERSLLDYYINNT